MRKILSQCSAVFQKFFKGEGGGDFQSPLIWLVGKYARLNFYSSVIHYRGFIWKNFKVCPSKKI